MDHREILLYGFHFSFFLVFFLAVVRDLYFVHYFNATINATAFLMTLVSYYLMHIKAKKALASYIIMAIAIIPLYILIYFNHFGNMVIVYVILLPIASFFLLNFKEAIVINTFMYILLIAMLNYIATITPDAPIISNPLALINIAFASVFIIFFGIFYHLAIDSSLSALIHSNRQKDILLKEVHHRVKNNLNVIASILGLQALGKSDETKLELQRSKTRIESIALVHEMLYKHSDYEEIIFNEYVEKLKKLILSMQIKSNVIKIEVSNNRISLPLHIMIQMGLMINEMLTNSLKHASNSNGVEISIILQRESDGYLLLYKDNGEKSVDIRSLTGATGLGFKLINLSTKQLGAQLELSYQNGLQYKVRFNYE